MKYFKLSIATLALIFTSKSYSQSYIPNYINVNNNLINNYFEIMDSSGWFIAIPDSNVLFSNFIDTKKEFLGLDSNNNFVLVKTNNDDYPFINQQNKLIHSRYNQYYKGLKVETAELFLHHKNDIIQFFNCKIAENLNLNVIPNISESQALTSAINILGDTIIYSWQDSAYLADIRDESEDSLATTFPAGELLITKINVNNDYSNNEFKLAWKFNIIAADRNLNVDIYIDAINGNLIKSYDNIKYGIATELSYGYGANVYLDTRWRGGLHSHYVLRSNDDFEPKVWTKKIRYSFFGHKIAPFGGYDINNSFNSTDVWPGIRGAEVTGHWLATQTLNYYKIILGRNSYDNYGTELKVYVDGDFLNAYWDSGIIGFGKKGGNHLCTKDIVGHEFTHGVIEKTAGLSIYNEPGAIQESFCDIFGYEVERYLNGGIHTNWTIGEDALHVQRNMANPSSFSQPAIYKGTNWHTSTDDHGGVHTNSQVQNYWFYLLTTGSTSALDGTHEGISVAGIGADKARNITYYNLDNFLGVNSDYNDSRNGSILAASILYGACSNEKKQTTNAWAAVGLGKKIDPLTISGPSFITYTPISSPGVPINYTVSGGDNSRTHNWLYTGPWSTSVSSIVRPWDNKKFSINNFNMSYPTNTVLTVSDNCNTTSINIHLVNRNLILTLSPNPVLTQLSVNVDLDGINVSNSLQVTITDGLGLIKHQSVQTSNQFSIDVSNYSIGNYFLNVLYNGENITEQFVKQ